MGGVLGASCLTACSDRPLARKDFRHHDWGGIRVFVTPESLSTLYKYLNHENTYIKESNTSDSIGGLVVKLAVASNRYDSQDRLAPGSIPGRCIFWPFWMLLGQFGVVLVVGGGETRQCWCWQCGATEGPHHQLPPPTRLISAYFCLSTSLRY
jgi:hypothetical protein